MTESTFTTDAETTSAHDATHENGVRSGTPIYSKSVATEEVEVATTKPSDSATTADDTRSGTPVYSKSVPTDERETPPDGARAGTPEDCRSVSS
jgi:hypothetical protein